MLELVNNSEGYTVVPCETLFSVSRSAILSSISDILQFPDLELDEATVLLSDKTHHEKIRRKKIRLLKNSLAEKVGTATRSTFKINNLDFVTDEERIGYENYYWRCVRADQISDVGSLHADRWFWDLNPFEFPRNYTRVKIWLPIVQDDAFPSLLIVPGSHKSKFTYQSVLGPEGKRRPVLLDAIDPTKIIHCPVKRGQCVAFNDALLHGGAVTSKTRISLEFTVAVQS